MYRTNILHQYDWRYRFANPFKTILSLKTLLSSPQWWKPWQWRGSWTARRGVACPCSDAALPPALFWTDSWSSCWCWIPPSEGRHPFPAERSGRGSLRYHGYLKARGRELKQDTGSRIQHRSTFELTYPQINWAENPLEFNCIFFLQKSLFFFSFIIFWLQ